MDAASARRRRFPALAMGVAAAVCAVSTASCSILLDWSSFSDGEPPDGSRPPPGDATVDNQQDGASGVSDSGTWVDGPALVSCGIDRQCSPALPSVPGWSGPYALLMGTPGSLPSCDTSVYAAQPAFDGMNGLDAGAAQCGCACSTPQNVECAPPNVTFYSDMTCTAAPCEPSQPLAGCVAIPSCAANLEISELLPAPGASCTPQPSTSIPPASWGQEGRACAPSSAATQGTCGTNQLCLPASTAFCIMFPGSADAQCPAGSDYPLPRTFYAGVTDQRACTSCSCGAPTVSCSVPSVNLGVGSFDSTCHIPTGEPFFVPVGCTAARISPAAFALAIDFDAGVEAGPCTPGAVGPTDGAATPSGPTTFCCTR